MFTAIAAVRIKPGMRDEFVRLIEPNARGAASEPGCIRFDLIQDRSDDHLVWFVEYYHSEEDFHIHQKTPHFLEWHPHLVRMLDSVVPNTESLGDSIYPPQGGWEGRD